MFHKFFDPKEEKKRRKREEEEEEDEEEEEGSIFDNYHHHQIDVTTTRAIFPRNTIISSNNSNNTKYLIIKEIGKGAFSNVYLAYSKRECDNDFDYVKKFVVKTTRCKPAYAKQAVKEYQHYNKIDNQSPYVIHFKDFFSIPNKTAFKTPCLVLEYFNQNFYTYMKDNFSYNNGLLINILFIVTKTMILGIDFLHKHNIIHCDLKPENIVINLQNQCKIIDLGSAIKTGFSENFCYMQSRYYRSPNCIVSADINPRIDFWSVGCIMYEALTMLPLFCKNNENDVLVKQLRFIEIPHDKINRYSKASRYLYNYQCKQWRPHIYKMNLFDYLDIVLKEKNIKRAPHEEEWIFNTKTGYCSLIDLCILKHYSEDENNYVKQLEIIEETYNSNSKFPSIAAI